MQRLQKVFSCSSDEVTPSLTKLLFQLPALHQPAACVTVTITIQRTKQTYGGVVRTALRKIFKFLFGHWLRTEWLCIQPFPFTYPEKDRLRKKCSRQVMTTGQPNFSYKIVIKTIATTAHKNLANTLVISLRTS